MCSTCHRASASLKTRLGNPSVICFQAKQTVRSQRVSRVVLPPSVLWRNQQTETCLVLSPKPRNCRGDFETQITKSELLVLRPKPSTLVLRLNQEIRSSKSPCARCRLHTVSPDLGRLATEYPTCATILGPLHQVSYSWHDPRRCTSCSTCHLHTTRQVNTILHTIQ
jgi:hypothetical protein